MTGDGIDAALGRCPADAERILSDGLRMLAGDKRRRIPGEEALWLYKRGAARAALGRQDGMDDLRAAIAAAPQPWVAGRARVEIAKMSLRKGDRDQAAAELSQAESLCQNGNDPLCVEEARKLSRTLNGR